MQVRTYGSFGESKPVVFQRAMDFGGRTWEPNRALAYMELTIAHSWPARNRNGHAITAATLANSLDTALNQAVNFEHAAGRICGTIAAIDLPQNAVSLAASGTAQALRALVAVHRRAPGVEKLLEDVVRDAASWRASMEWDFRLSESALWDGQRARLWSEVPEIVRAGATKENNVSSFPAPFTLLCGGLDGAVVLTGAAFTRNPADEDTEILRLAANDQDAELEIRLWQQGDGRIDRVNRLRKGHGLPPTTATEFVTRHGNALSAANREAIEQHRAEALKV